MRWVSMYDAADREEADARDEDREAPLTAADDGDATPPVFTARGETAEGVGQGSYVTSFTMTRDQVATGAEAARAMLPQLLSECSWRPTGDKHDGSVPAWRQVKSGKCTARVWEKGGAGKLKRALRKQPPSKPSTTVVQQAANTSTASGSATSASATALTSSEPEPSKSTSRVVYSVRSSVTVDAPLDTLLQTLDTSVLTAHRSFTKIIYGGVVSEASVLSHHDQCRSALRCEVDSAVAESLAVRWLVCRCNSPMVSDCDLCLQEYTRRHSIDELAANSAVYNNNNNNNNNGDEEQVERVRDGLHSETEIPAAYKLFHSVETRFCPELLESQRLVRCRVPIGGFLLYPTDSSDRTDVVFFMSVAQERTDRQFCALQSVALEMARRVERLRNVVDAYRMSLRLDALRSSRWVDDSARPECAVCARRFHQLSRRRHHCRLCGEVICRDCSVHKDADLPTIGPTVLRICRQCDVSTDGIRLQTLQSSPLPSSVAAIDGSASSSSNASNQSNQSNQAARSRRDHRMSWRRATSIEISMTTPAPSAPATPTMAAATRPTKPDEEKRDTKPATPSSLESRRRFSTAVDTAVDDAHGVSQAFSCPKPAPDQRSIALKWGAHNSESGGRLAAKAVATTPTMKSHAYPAPAPGIWRAVGGAPSRWTGTSNNNNNNNASDSQPAPGSAHRVDTRAKALSSASPSVRSPMQRWHRHSVDESTGKLPRRVFDASVVPPGSPNQHADAASRATPLIPHGISKLHEVQDILVDLCAQAAMLCGTKYAALSMFRDRSITSAGSSAAMRASKASQQPEDDGSPGAGTSRDKGLAAGMEHFLKVRGSHKLMNVAPNLKSCEPLLALRRSVATRNAASASLDFDFKQLPIVAGPQQARFYAGVLLVDSRSQWLGALAVFDSRVDTSGAHAHEDNKLQALLRGVEKLASAAVASIREREKELALQQFLRFPLIETRNSEPGQPLGRREELRRRTNFRSDGVVESEGEEIEEVRRQEHVGVGTYSSASASASPQHAREFYRNKMRELVLRAQETQAQTLENSMAMKREGLIT